MRAMRKFLRARFMVFKYSSAPSGYLTNVRCTSNGRRNSDTHGPRTRPLFRQKIRRTSRSLVRRRSQPAAILNFSMDSQSVPLPSTTPTAAVEALPRLALPHGPICSGSSARNTLSARCPIDSPGPHPSEKLRSTLEPSSACCER